MEMNLSQLCDLDPMLDDIRILGNQAQASAKKGAQLECCFFYSWAAKFQKLHDERKALGHVVMILQLCKVKYFNEKEEFDPNNHSIALFSPVKKEVTADEFFKGAIKKMVGSIRDSDSSFHCILSAKIHKIHHEFRWTYLACKRYGRSAKEMDQCKSSCSSTKGKKEKVWNYKIHKALNASGVGMRFKVNVRVIDVSGSASLLLFDDLVFKLGGEQCYNLIKKYGENRDEYFPDELNVLTVHLKEKQVMEMVKASPRQLKNDGGDSGSGKRTIIDLDDYKEEAVIAKRGKKVIPVKLEPKD
ncbi:replication protein A 70 kDa DNA-binding subunit B [Tanacetum coccineum]